MSKVVPQGAKRQRGVASGAPQPAGPDATQHRPAIEASGKSGAAQPAVSEQPQEKQPTTTISTSGAAQPARPQKPPERPATTMSTTSDSARVYTAEKPAGGHGPWFYDVHGASGTAQRAGTKEQENRSATPMSTSSATAPPAATENKQNWRETTKSTGSGEAPPAPPQEPAQYEEADYEADSPRSSTSGDAHPAVRDEGDEAAAVAVTSRSSGSGASQLAAPGVPEEERKAKNGYCYTKKVWFAYYKDCREYAATEWAAMPVVCRGEPGDAIQAVQDMYAWYLAHIEDEDIPEVFRHLQHTLFKNVTKELDTDVWKGPATGGASQPAVKREVRMVVSREYVTQQVKTVIESREKWLKENHLPLNTVLRGEKADQFLDDMKADYHASPEQQGYQNRDADQGKSRKSIQAGKHSRWSRNQQRLGGTPQMWTLLSFTGRFDVEYLQAAILKGKNQQPLRMPGEKTPDEKKNHRRPEGSSSVSSGRYVGARAPKAIRHQQIT